MLGAFPGRVCFVSTRGHVSLQSTSPMLQLYIAKDYYFGVIHPPCISAQRHTRKPDPCRRSALDFKNRRVQALSRKKITIRPKLITGDAANHHFHRGESSHGIAPGAHAGRTQRCHRRTLHLEAAQKCSSWKRASSTASGAAREAAAAASPAAPAAEVPAGAASAGVAWRPGAAQSRTAPLQKRRRGPAAA